MPNKSERLYAAAGLVSIAAALLIALNIQPERLVIGDEVALVNGVAIPQSEYLRALDAMQSSLERPLTAEDRRRAISLLIDEELLVQQALRLRLAEDDRLVRKNLVQAMMTSARVLAPLSSPDDKELRAFYQENKALFREPVLVDVAAAYSENVLNVDQAAQAISSGVPFLEASEAAGLSFAEIPSQIPLGKLSDYLGSSIRDSIISMEVSDIAGPVSVGGRNYLVWLRGKSGGKDLEFEAVRDEAERYWRQRNDEQALERYLERLRKNASIKISGRESNGPAQ